MHFYNEDKGQKGLLTDLMFLGPGGPEVSVKSQVNTGIVLDGIKVIHGVQRYRPDKTAPSIGRGEHFLTYHPDEDIWWITGE